MLGVAGTLSASAQTSQPTTLPPLSVETKKAVKSTKRAAPKQRQAAPAPPPAPAPAAPLPAAPETATSPVRDYVATQSATGTKTDTPLRETPQSISVVGTEQIRDQGAQALQEALRYVPGVVPDGFGFDSRGDYILVRGIPAAYFLDGVRTAFGYYANTAGIEPYGLERVEVLRGPSSMLYGQSSAGGIVNAISKRPKDTPHAEIGAEYGSYDWRQVTFDVGGPVTTDSRWLYRFVGLMRESGTQVDYVDNDRIFLAPSLTFRPSADTNITLLGTWRKDQGGSVQQFFPHEGTLFPNSITGKRVPMSRFVGEPTDYNDTDQQSVSLLIDHKFNPWLSVHHGTRYTHTDNTYSTHYTAPLTAGLAAGLPFLDPANVPFLDASRQNIARVYLWRNTETDVVTSDTNLTAKLYSGPVAHKVTAGFDYTRYETGGAGTPILVDNLIPFAPGGPFGPQAPFNIYNPTYGNNAWYLNFGTNTPVFADDIPIDQRDQETQTQRGLYIQDQIKFGAWTAVLGLRKDWLTIKQSGRATDEVSEVTGRAGLMYHFDFGLSPYVSYSQSFAAQPGNQVTDEPLAPNPELRPAAPLEGEQFEVGFKYQVPGRPFVINAAYFDLKEKNRLVDDILSGFAEQGAEAHIRGFELEAVGRVSENIKLMAGYTYMDAKYSDHFDAFEVGTPVEGIPRHMASLWGVYTETDGTFKGFSIGGGVRYVGESKDYGELVTGAFGTVTTPGFTLFDAMIAYERDSWRWQLVGQNLADKYHVVTCTTRGDCGLGQGRTIITRLTYKF